MGRGKKGEEERKGVKGREVKGREKSGKVRERERE